MATFAHHVMADGNIAITRRIGNDDVTQIAVLAKGLGPGARYYPDIICSALADWDSVNARVNERLPIGIVLPPELMPFAEDIAEGLATPPTKRNGHQVRALDTFIKWCDANGVVLPTKPEQPISITQPSEGNSIDVVDDLEP